MFSTVVIGDEGETLYAEISTHTEANMLYTRINQITGKERKGKERKGKERKGKERKGKKK